MTAGDAYLYRKEKSRNGGFFAWKNRRRKNCIFSHIKIEAKK